MILISGGNGFLGKIIIKEMTKKIYSLGRSGDLDISIDLSIEIPVLPEVDLVIHCAGKAHSVPKNDVEKKEFFDVNVTGTANLLKGLEKSGLPKQFVFISSVSVYGLETGQLIKEDAPLLAKDPYGLSKITAEQLVVDWCTQNKVICTILRLPLLVGENPPGNLGSMLKAIDKGYYFNVGGGKAKKSMVLAIDVAKFIPVVASFGGIYNLTDGRHPDFARLSAVIAYSKNKKKPLNMPLFLAKSLGFIGDFLGNKSPMNSLKIKKITSDLTFDDSKARELLQWNPKSVVHYISNNTI
jgi:nucleoside-diphosphate-sugar epimerase